MTAYNVILVCLFMQVAITYIALLRMGKAKLNSHKSREVSFADIAIDNGNYPDRVRQFQNNVTNQFESPILFYVAVVTALALDEVNWGVAVGAVIYVVFRIVHHFIHTGSNHVVKRFNSYVMGLIGALISWVSLGLGLLGII